MISSSVSNDNRQRYKDFGSGIWDLGFKMDFPHIFRKSDLGFGIYGVIIQVNN